MNRYRFGNKRYKYLHLMSNDKFIVPYIDFIEQFFDFNEHFFIIIVKKGRVFNEIPQKESIKVVYFSNSGKVLNELKYYRSIIKYLLSIKKIYLHGIFWEIIPIIFSHSWVLKKINWVIWGGDLYSYQKSKITLKSKLYEFMRAYCIKRFGGFITYLEGDYNFAKKWYNTNGKHLDCIMYPSNIYKDLIFNDFKKQDIYIQVGNSADSFNNHIEILDKLKKYKEDNVKIICPLSYGDSNNAKKVKKYGEKIFGSKFNALLDFLDFEEYVKLLNKIDIAIFNHKRQQAMGNTITLLGLGKTVYLRSDTTSWELFESLNIKIKDSKNNINLDKLNNLDIQSNKQKVKKRFSEKNLKKEWEKIFNG